MINEVEDNKSDASWDKPSVSEDESEVALTMMNELDELALRSVDADGKFSQIFIADT